MTLPKGTILLIFVRVSAVKVTSNAFSCCLNWLVLRGARTMELTLGRDKVQARASSVRVWPADFARLASFA